MILVSAKHTCYKLSKMSHKIRLERVEELYSIQEETDTKIFLHANHAAALGHSSILIKSSDTDVEERLWHSISNGIFKHDCIY